MSDHTETKGITLPSAEGRPFKWRAVWIHPTFAPGVPTRTHLKVWWGNDVWFGRWPALKMMAAWNLLLTWKAFR